ncbi:MAG: methyltransferase domain-containing protein, partial [Acidimicrobiales bacterium]
MTSPEAGEAADRWREELAAWAVPPEILAAAPQRPFVFPPEMFAAPAPGTHPPTRSTAIAADAIRDGGVVLDVGCGGGAAGFALAPPATELIGTDRQQDMTELFANTAAERGIPCQVVTG